MVCLGAPQSGRLSWEQLRARNPPGIDISLSLEGPASYREGERIQVKRSLPGWSVPPSQGSPAEQWQFVGFLLEPAAGCGTLASPCTMAAGGGPGPEGLFGPHQAFRQSISLNRYLPRLGPGRYRAAGLARKLVLKGRAPMSATYGYADPPVYAVSNAIRFQVTAASNAWMEKMVSSSVALAARTSADDRLSYEAKREAAEQISYLDHPAAWKASLELLPLEESILLSGLAATRQPSRVCELMESAVPAPEQAVSQHYLATMAQICLKAHQPPPAGYERSVLELGYAGLAGAIGGKRGEKKTAALHTLMERVQYLELNEPRQPMPAWLSPVRAEFLRAYPAMEKTRKPQMLSLFASAMPGPELASLLEFAMDEWKPGDDYEAPQAALRALSRLDPVQAQARIRAELRKERTWLDMPLLEMLPPEAARLNDGDLIDALAAAQKPGGWNPLLRMTALAKYASPRALSRIRAIYESQQDRCQPELIAYFVRVDAAYADRIFHQQAWDMHAPADACTVRIFGRTPRFAMSPELERYMVAYLMHQDPQVKMAAAQSLGRYGSAAALPALWSALRYFHDYWNGKVAELRQNGQGEFLEVELNRAIARARNWVAAENDLRTIRSLCISERCQYESDQDLRAWQKPMRIEVSIDPNGFRGTVAQYFNLESMAALKEKISQFPKGTAFAAKVWGRNPDEMQAEIERHLAASGMALVR